MQAGAFDDDWVNILFVGRMIPNKRIEDVIRAFHAYKRWFNPRSRLLLVGSHGGFERYLAMVHDFVARLGAADVHMLGHVSNEELAAYYEIADVFLCASEHEGFCVPLMEAFHMGVPVVAHAATAVPATMDGGGVLFGHKDPIEIAGILDALVSNASLRESVLAKQDAALDRLLAKDFGGLLLGFVDEALARPRLTTPPVAFDFWDQVRQAEWLEEIRAGRPAAFQALPEEPELVRKDLGIGSRDPMTVNQWVPAAHKGDAIGDSARRVRGLLRGMGHQSDLFALTIDEDLVDDVRPFAEPGCPARRPDDLPLRAALADDRSVRDAAARARAAVPQRHAGSLLRALSRRHLPAGRARSPGAGDAGRPHRRGARRLRVQSRRARVARLRQDRRLPHRHRHRADHAGAAAAGARAGAERRSAELPVRRPHRAEQEDRGSHPPGGDVQAVCGRELPLHLRRQDRRRAAVLQHGAGAHRPVRDAGGSVLVHRSGAERGPGRLLPHGQCLHLALGARGLLRAAARGDGGGRAGAGLRDRRRSRTRSVAPASRSNPRISSSRPNCSASSPTTTRCARR